MDYEAAWKEYHEAHLKGGWTADERHLFRSGFNAALTAAKSQDAELLRALSDAVGKLPVEEMVHADRQGNLELIGYAMQAQGEWDIVVRAKAAADTHLSGDPA